MPTDENRVLIRQLQGRYPGLVSDISALDGRVTTLEGYAAETIIGLSPTTVASPTGTIGMTGADVSASVPAGYGKAVLRVTIGGTRTSNGTFGNNRCDFRKDSGSQIAATVGVSIANPVASAIGVQVVQSVHVPLTTARTFEYSKTEAAGLGSAGATIELIGYLR